MIRNDNGINFTFLQKQGVEFSIATVTGDDLMPHREALISEGVKEMFSGKVTHEKKTISGAATL